VESACPHVFYPEGRIYANSRPVLKTSTRRVLTSVDRPAHWGGAGEFPFISWLLDTFFSTSEQKEYFPSWLAYFYRACYEQKPCPGQAIFIAGPSGVGKSLLSRGILGGLFGGFVDAREFLLGGDSFGGELFEFGLWCIDDAVSLRRPKDAQRTLPAAKGDGRE
jgi:hypothetical protein